MGFMGWVILGPESKKRSLLFSARSSSWDWDCDYSSHRKPLRLLAPSKSSLELALFLYKKANETYLFLDGSGGKLTTAGKATGEDPGGSGFVPRRLSRCPRKATSRSGHLFDKDTDVLKTKRYSCFFIWSMAVIFCTLQVNSSCENIHVSIYCMQKRRNIGFFKK